MYMDVLIAALFVLGVQTDGYISGFGPCLPPDHKFIATTFPS